jgi:hypothetical protein
VIEPIRAPSSGSLVDAARVAIWRLFQEGYVDEDMATASLLAVDLGTRRTRQRPTPATGAWPTGPASNAHDGPRLRSVR